MADDFTTTLLHAIQNERTTPSGGWLSTGQIARGAGLSAGEAHHVADPLKELHGAGMIEKRFNAAKGVDEWRSRGVLATPGRLNEVLVRAEGNGHDFMDDLLDGPALPESTGAEEYTVAVSPAHDAEEVLNSILNQLRGAGAPAALQAHFSFRLGYHYGGRYGARGIKAAIAWAAKECSVGVIFTNGR